MTEAQTEFPPILVEYARKKMETDRDLIEYFAKFGPPFLKGGARMILAAAGEKVGT